MGKGAMGGLTYIVAENDRNQRRAQTADEDELPGIERGRPEGVCMHGGEEGGRSAAEEMGV
jgi:hypothetical protein